MRNTLFSLILAVLLPPSFVSAQSKVGNDSKAELCNIAESAIASASQIRGLSIKHRVPCLVGDKEAIRKYLLNTIDTKLPAGRMQMEEFVYKGLGFIPDSYNYQQGIVDLYVSQIGGYYDPEKNHFVMAAWMPAILQTTIAVHELTHALQDQYFNLDTYIDIKLDNSDMLLARSAVVEGDATAVMMDYQRKLIGQPPLSTDASVDSLMFQNVLGASLMGNMSGVPQSLQLMLLFPYTSGLRFVHTVMSKGGGYKKLDAMFKDPPTSTEQILHPEKYGASSGAFKTIDVAEVQSEFKSDERIVYQDTVGEFGTSALLGMFLNDKTKAAQAAAGWNGDRVFVVEDAAGVKTILWKSEWDSEKDLNEFFEAYSEALKRRYPSYAEGHFSHEGRTGSFKRANLGALLSVQYSSK